MDSLSSIFNRIFPLSDELLERVSELCREVHYPRGYLLFEAGRVQTDVYFLKQGVARAYCDTHDTELSFWFGLEGDVVLSYNSYISEKPGYENIELLEPSTLYHIKGADLQALYLSSAEMANWGRKLAEYELVKTEERLISRQFRSAAERYKDLLGNRPELLQRIALCHIASYLGVTQVTLSRIRSEIR